jgi:hypothetical protein
VIEATGADLEFFGDRIDRRFVAVLIKVDPQLVNGRQFRIPLFGLSWLLRILFVHLGQPERFSDHVGVFQNRLRVIGQILRIDVSGDSK